MEVPAIEGGSVTSHRLVRDGDSFRCVLELRHRALSDALGADKDMVRALPAYLGSVALEALTEMLDDPHRPPRNEPRKIDNFSDYLLHRWPIPDPAFVDGA